MGKYSYNVVFDIDGSFFGYSVKANDAQHAIEQARELYINIHKEERMASMEVVLIVETIYRCPVVEVVRYK